MTTQTKVPQGTAPWFDMVGTLLVAAATGAGLSRDLNVSLVERYTDGAELSDDLVQGIRLDMRHGELFYRAGARRDEQAEIVVEITAAAAHELNTLYTSDPNFQKARDRLLATGEMRVDGDPSRFGLWFDAMHDPIVDRTI